MLQGILQFIQTITPVVAFVALFLGIWSTVHILRKDRIRIKVIPRINEQIDEPELAIRIMNKSYLTVTIEQISLIAKRPKDKRLKLPAIYLDDASTPPKTMEPRTSWTPKLSLRKLILKYYENEELRYIKHVVVETACGKSFNGRSKSLKQYTSKLSDNSSREP
jgi:hypothetical protein